MELKELAHELGKKIQESVEMQEMQAAEALQEQNAAAQEALKEFNLKRMNLARDLQEKKISQEDAVKKNNEAFQQLLAEHDCIRVFVEKKKAFDTMVGEVNGILNYYITGQEPGGCTHNCSSCGGCH
ncbi:MAG: YlbF family regulator [Ruminococcaceae bacterium]|nr:YlbF family regulator [Oscillospiraceae bacterium]